MRNDWDKVGQFEAEVEVLAGLLFSDKGDKLLTTTKQPDGWYQLMIHFRSEGYYETPRTLGRYEDWSPAEGDDHRTVVSAELVDEAGQPYLFDYKDAETLFDHYIESIYSVDL